MFWLEARFRAKFEPSADGYLFRQDHRDVRFSADEVEAIVADWRRYWFSPMFWLGWLVLGVIAPALFITSGNDFAAACGWALLATITIVYVVLLVQADRAPNAAAETRVPSNPVPDDPQRYTAAEYDAAMAERQAMWRRPKTWLVLFLVGAVAPAMLYWDGDLWYAGGIAALALGMSVYSLIDAYLEPDRVARRRARGEPEPVKPVVREGIWAEISGPLFFTFWTSIQFDPRTTHLFHTRWLMVAAALYLWGELAIRWMRHRRIAQPA